jgi:hypothetical protein
MAGKTDLFEIVEQPHVVVALFLDVLVQVRDQVRRNCVAARQDLAPGQRGFYERDRGTRDVMTPELKLSEEFRVGPLPEVDVHRARR